MSELQKTESALVNDLEEFLRAFKDRTGNYKYFDRINNLMAANSTSLVVDYIDFDTFKPELAKLITNEPDEMFDAFNKAIFNVLYEIHPDYANEIQNNIKVRMGNYTVQKSLREINAEVINKLVGVSGMVVRSSEVKPLAKKIGYRCLNCSEITEAQLRGLVLKQPLKCGKCSEKELEMDPDTSIFIDFQMVRLQELPEDLPAGHLPHYLEVTIIGDLVDQCRPGDRILLTGIVRIEQEQLSQQIKTSLFRLRMEGNNIEYLGGRTADKDNRTIEHLEINSEDEKHIFALARKNDAYDILISSYAPHVYGHEVIKEVILLLIVGSVTKRLDYGTARRGDINVLLVGDPGTAKSEMLKFAAKIAPRGLYTSGRGSTAAGLTAAVIRDKSGIMMLEAGAVVLGDQGLVCIDEFDKIKPEDRSALHEVMEQQTCSVAKGGIVATLNARTSILAAANPLYGKYDP
ncbi:MAG: AAA family ATPase, partial [Nitrososphaerales archaeon]